MKSIIEITDLGYFVQSEAILQHINCEVPKGQICGLIMDNTEIAHTMLQLLTGLLEPSTGSIKILGQPNGIQVRGDIGATFDIASFKEQYSVEKNFKILCMIKDMDYKKVRKKLRLFGLEEIQSTLFGKCSPAIQKRLALVCALTGNQKLILIDENIQCLSVEENFAIITTLQKMAKNGKTILFNAHKQSSLSDIPMQIIDLTNPKMPKKLLINKKHKVLQAVAN